MSPGKIAVAATAFACTTLLSFGWSAQHGASLLVASAQAIENTKDANNAKDETKDAKETKDANDTKETKETNVTKKNTKDTKTQISHRQTHASVTHVARRHYRQSADRAGPAPVRGRHAVAAGPGRAAAGPETAGGPAATTPYRGGGPYAAAEGWQGAGYASSPWGDHDCQPTSKFECRPYASKTWK
jgi:hypothetical protein